MKMSEELQATVETAIAEARERRHEYVTLEHLLLALCADPRGIDILQAVGTRVPKLVEQLEKYFGTNHVLRGVDLEVRQREAVMVIGRSGSGKTTLLRCINFLEEPTAGSVEVDGLRLDADQAPGAQEERLNQPGTVAACRGARSARSI